MFIYIYYISRAEFEKGDNRIRALTMLAFVEAFYGCCSGLLV